MRRLEKKYKRPRRPWDIAVIKSERETLKAYGLRRKHELRKSEAILRKFRHRARMLISKHDREEESALLSSLRRSGLLAEKAGLDDVLALNVSNILERRLETIVLRKGMAKTPLQARQLVTHGSIRINGRKIVYPSYLVPVAEEGIIEKVEHAKKGTKASARTGKAGGSEAVDRSEAEAGGNEGSSEGEAGEEA